MGFEQESRKKRSQGKIQKERGNRCIASGVTGNVPAQAGLGYKVPLAEGFRPVFFCKD